MTTPTRTPASMLRLIPLHFISRYARIGAEIIMATTRRGFDSGAIPGTIFIENTSTGGLVNKKITFTRADLSLEVEQMLRGLRFLRVVAVYRDEAGNIRICGSPSYPLTLEYSTTSGGYEVTLTGADTETDGYWRH